jgi:hypothetical protein
MAPWFIGTGRNVLAGVPLAAGRAGGPKLDQPGKMKLTNLGKPRAARRIRCLAVGHDGKVYLMAGERSAAWPCQAYSYDPREGGFSELGLLIVDRSPYYYWRGYQFDAMVVGLEGTLYLGESERRSHLFLFLP